MQYTNTYMNSVTQMTVCPARMVTAKSFFSKVAYSGSRDRPQEKFCGVGAQGL